MPTAPVRCENVLIEAEALARPLRQGQVRNIVGVTAADEFTWNGQTIDNTASVSFRLQAFGGTAGSHDHSKIRRRCHFFRIQRQSPRLGS